jgi:hypothetical protein
MWKSLYRLWRSVLRRPRPAPTAESPPDPLRQELRGLLLERDRLLETLASYQEFGYDELAARVRDDLAAIDRRIRALRLRLRGKPAAPGRP